MSLSGSWVRDQFALVICRYHPWGCIHSTKGFWRSRVGRDGKVACLHGSQNYFLTARAALPRNWTLPSWFCFWKCKCWKWTSSAFLMEKCTTVPLMSRSLYAESVTWDTDLEVLFFIGLWLHHSCTKRLRDQSLRLLSSLFWTAVMNAAMSERSTLSIFTSCCNSKEMRSQLRWCLRITRCGFARTNQRAFCTDTETCLNSKSDELGFKYFDIVAIFQYLPDVLH